MIIHVYALCWNEEKMLPFFFKHYDNIADQYYIFDNDSTDNSVSMLKANPKVSINRFEIEGNSVVKSAQDLFNQCWKESREKADWVIICDVDEHFYHPNLRTYLQECTSKGITLVVPSGYEMVSDYFPNSSQPLYETVRNGVRSQTYDKPQIFNPTAIQDINFGPGRHTASPTGNVIEPSNNEVLLLHYKYLGFDYLNSRFSDLKQGLREGDTVNHWGFHYLWDEKQKLKQFEDLKNRSVSVL
ncbi:glycosyltransferase family 2 protein [Paenibacillus sp. 1-18]|uniref:glycosyltransferase family 2 protein n=1 Tax=Paenibacillus sp. 1-18 TaxID=1333846 RepID=UPI0004716DC7|nr:glycosyltransferase family 2 protein [Paenibacillus sp. 1-18]